MVVLEMVSRSKVRPGKESQVKAISHSDMQHYKGAGKLKGKVALITGGDSGIGRAVAIGMAKEGADIAISYLSEHDDAKETMRRIKALGRKCWIMAGDIGNERHCQKLIANVIKINGRLDIIVNNAGEQLPKKSVRNISQDQLRRTFDTNIFSMFYIVKAATPHLKKGSAIINTASVTAYKGNPLLLDYSATKGAITAFTRSLATSLAKKGIRVNAVAPGPIWTPLIPSTFDDKELKEFGKDTAMGRAGQPDEVAPAFIFLASSTDSSYITGQTIHVNGGIVVNS